MIPKFIHQYWNDGELPDEFKVFTKLLKTLNYKYAYNLWNKESVLDKFSNHPLIKYLDYSTNPVSSSDIARIILLDSIGGIYLDSDMKPNRGFPEYMLRHDCFACYENEYHFGQTVANGAIGSTKNSKFIQKLINEILSFDINKISGILSIDSWKILGPRLWTKVFFDSKCKDIFVYPSWYFIPNYYNDDEKNLTDGYIATHVWKNHYRYKKWNSGVYYVMHQQALFIDRFQEIEQMKS